MAKSKLKRSPKSIQRKLTRRRKPERAQPGNKIVLRAPGLPRNPYELKEEHVTLIKNTIAKGATDLELQLFLATAKRHRLDPFTHQIWLVPRWDRNADSGQKDRNGQPILGAYVRTTQIGIDGFLHIAGRDHRDFGSISLPEYGPIVAGHPEWARVKVFKKGLAEPTIAEAWWEEYSPSDLSKAPFWRKMPRRMLAKCATALAIRQAYPETFSGIYIPEECEKVAEDFTPSGRKIIETVSPSEQAYLDREQEQLKKLTPAQREVVERRMSEASRQADQRGLHGAKETGTGEKTGAGTQVQSPRSVSAAGAEPGKTPTGAPAVYYRWFQESQTARIEPGPAVDALTADLKAAIRRLGIPGPGRSVIFNGEQFDALKFEFEKRGVRLELLKAGREPGSDG